MNFLQGLAAVWKMRAPLANTLKGGHQTAGHRSAMSLPRNRGGSAGVSPVCASLTPAFEGETPEKAGGTPAPLAGTCFLNAMSLPLLASILALSASSLSAQGLAQLNNLISFNGTNGSVPLCGLVQASD